MNKVIHGAVRRDLARFLGALHSFRGGDRGRAEHLATAWDNFVRQLTHHHEGEHQIVWPVLRSLGADQHLLVQMDAEHDRLAEALAAAGGQMEHLRTTPTVSAAAAAHQAMEVLRTVAEEHLTHEESELEPFYAAKEGDPALRGLGRRLAGNSPAAAGTFLAWVTDQASAEELAAVRRHVPRPVVAILGTAFGRRYRREVASVWR